MNFIGKICPYCKTEFKEEDDVVICINCEMPHHKECWIENKACTTFGCTGTIMGTNDFIGDNNLSVNNNLASANTVMNTNDDKRSFFCTKCGAAYIYGKAICDSCGNSLLNDGKNNYNSYNGAIMDEDIETFVGENHKYFLKVFQKFDLSNSKESWNWASAFFTGYWLAYRKMYKIQFLYYAVLILMRVMLGRAMSSILELIIFVPSGVYGNYLYKKHVEKHIQKTKNMDHSTKQSYLIDKGGTSDGLVLMIFALRIVVEIYLRKNLIR